MVYGLSYTPQGATMHKSNINRGLIDDNLEREKNQNVVNVQTGAADDIPYSESCLEKAWCLPGARACSSC